MAYNKPKRPLQPITIPGIGDVAVRGLLLTERESVVMQYGGVGQRMMFMLQMLQRTVVDPENGQPIMTIEEWDEAAAADVEAAQPAFMQALKLSGLSGGDVPADTEKKD